MVPPPVFALEDEEGYQGWLRGRPRAVVLLAGQSCPYSATFRRVFDEIDPGCPRAVRIVEHGGRGPAGERLGVQTTPTVVACLDGREARLEGRLLLGITRKRYREWLREVLGDAA